MQVESKKDIATHETRELRPIYTRRRFHNVRFIITFELPESNGESTADKYSPIKYLFAYVLTPDVTTGSMWKSKAIMSLNAV